MVQQMTAVIHSKDFASVIAEQFEVLIDTDKSRGPVLAIKVDPLAAPAFIMPMDYSTAKALAKSIFRALYRYAPELFADEFASVGGRYSMPLTIFWKR